MTTFNNLRAANQDRMAEWKGASFEELLEFVKANPYTAARTIASLFSAVELAGEVGEALNIVKKMTRSAVGMAGNYESNDELRSMLCDELADVAICTDLMAIRENVDLDTSVPRKFNKTTEKCGLKVKLEK